MKIKIQNLFTVVTFFCFLHAISFAQNSLHLVGSIVGSDSDHQLTNISGAGDVNGDGYADFMVSSENGKFVRVYFGGMSFDTTRYLKIGAWEESSFYILEIACAGDVNNDGYDDILVGLIDYTLSGLNKGRVFLYLGGEQMDTIPDLDFYEKWVQDEFGSSVSGAGDVNGDGVDDFMIGSHYNWSDGMGRVYLYFGGDSLSALPAITFETLIIEDFFGIVTSGLGDIDNDGFDDIAIAAPYLEVSNEYLRKVYIYKGGREMDTIPDYKFDGNTHYFPAFGDIVTTAGDLNNDGYSDLLLCYPAKIYYGNRFADMSTFSPELISGEEMGNSFGFTFSDAGDINNDGFSDILIGEMYYVNGDEVMVGKIFGYYGGETMDSLPDFSMEGENKWDEFSREISPVGDYNNDGHEEFIILAPNYPNYDDPQGKVYLYSYAPFSSIEETGESGIIKGYDLYQNYPNPFNHSTAIKFSVPTSSHIRIDVFNAAGQKVQTRVNQRMNPGTYRISFDGSDLASGVYLYRMMAGDYTAVKKMLLVK